MTQEDILNLYQPLRDSNGSVSRPHLVMIWGNPTWKADLEGRQGRDLTYDHIYRKLSWGPVLIGYFDFNRTKLGYHANVVIAPSVYEEKFEVMEPDGGQFQVKGFTAFGRGYVLLAWPRP
jgi:hypothetical protein